MQRLLRRSRWLVAGVLATVAVGCGGPPLPDDASYVRGNAGRGWDVFATACGTCHGRDAKGITAKGPALVPASAAQANLTEAGEYRFLRAKHAALPELVDEQVRDVSAYVQSIRQR